MEDPYRKSVMNALLILVEFMRRQKRNLTADIFMKHGAQALMQYDREQMKENQK